jgi:hypothetical protein
MSREQVPGGLRPEPERVPRVFLENPKVQAAIEDALDRARRGDTKPGSTPEQLEALADEQLRRLDP